MNAAADLLGKAELSATDQLQIQQHLETADRHGFYAGAIATASFAVALAPVAVPIYATGSLAAANLGGGTLARFALARIIHKVANK